MKNFLSLISMAAMIILSGCYNPQALERKVPQKKNPQRLREKKQANGELFDKVYHRSQERFENSSLSAKERKMIENNDSRNNREIRKIREKNRNTKNQDWVFGTENGSLF